MKNITADPDPMDEFETMPRISLIVPYELKMSSKAGLCHLLENQAYKTEKELLTKFPEERVALVIGKLKHVIKSVHCPAEGKSLGIFVSPMAEKVYYFMPSHLDDYNFHF